MVDNWGGLHIYIYVFDIYTYTCIDMCVCVCMYLLTCLLCVGIVEGSFARLRDAV